MRQNHIVSLSQTGYKTVSVVFELVNDPKRAWTYKAADALELSTDDLVVVQANTSFKVGRVSEVHAEPQIDTESDIDYKWVVDKVDLTLFNQIQANEEAFLLQLKKMQQKSVQTQIQSTLAEQFGGSVDDVSKAVSDFLDVTKVASNVLGVKQLPDQSK